MNMSSTNNTQKINNQGNSTLQFRYIGETALNLLGTTEVKDVDLRDCEEISKMIQTNIGSKVSYNELKTAYRDFYSALLGLAQSRVEEMDRMPLSDKKVTLKFQNPVLYLYNEEIQEYLQISHTDPGFSYMYLFMRETQKKTEEGKPGAFNLLPKYVLTFRNNSPRQYTQADVVKSFKYFYQGINLEPDITNANGKPQLRSDVWERYKAEKDIFNQIFSHTAEAFYNACDRLRRSDERQELEICMSITNQFSVNRNLEFLACKEIFHRIKWESPCMDVDQIQNDVDYYPKD